MPIKFNVPKYKYDHTHKKNLIAHGDVLDMLCLYNSIYKVVKSHVIFKQYKYNPRASTSKALILLFVFFLRANRNTYDEPIVLAMENMKEIRFKKYLWRLQQDGLILRKNKFVYQTTKFGNDFIDAVLTEFYSKRGNIWKLIFPKDLEKDIIEGEKESVTI